MKRNLSLLALALALVLAAAACGGGDSGAAGGERLSKEEYIAKVKAVDTKLNETMDQLDATISDPKAGAKKQFETLGAALKAAADDLDALNPPEEIRGAHEKFAEGVSMLGDDIAKAASEVRGDDAGAMMALMAALADSDALKKVQEAVDELEKAGYDVG